MSNAFQIKIEPYKFYNKYAGQSYVLCGVRFDFLGAEAHSFRSECDNECLLEIMSAIDEYLSGNIKQDTELYYHVPWIYGEVYYPFSFRIDVEKKQWIFRYKKSINDAEFDFEYPMDEDDLRSMRSQIEGQYVNIDWQSLGKSELFTFDLAQKELEWCYSAKAFCEALNKLCRGKKIEAVYVGAANYADPLRVRENYVNYYLGSEVFVQMDGTVLALSVAASGLFQWRAFDRSEISIKGPRVDFIEDGYREFCEIRDVYKAFRLEYRNTAIAQVTIEDTDCWPWHAYGFDESKLGDPIELPEKVSFHLENGTVLSFIGRDDDFVIRVENFSE